MDVIIMKKKWGGHSVPLLVFFDIVNIVTVFWLSWVGHVSSLLVYICNNVCTILLASFKMLLHNSSPPLNNKF